MVACGSKEQYVNNISQFHVSSWTELKARVTVQCYILLGWDE